MKKQSIDFASRARFPFLSAAALLLAAWTTDTVKAEPPACIDDVAGGICVPLETTAKAKPSESQAVVSNAAGDCDVVAGICETQEMRALAVAQSARTKGAPAYASACDAVGGVCHGVDGSSSQLAKARRRGIGDRADVSTARASQTPHTSASALE